MSIIFNFKIKKKYPSVTEKCRTSRSYIGFTEKCGLYFLNTWDAIFGIVECSWLPNRPLAFTGSFWWGQTPKQLQDCSPFILFFGSVSLVKKDGK